MFIKLVIRQNSLLIVKRVALRKLGALLVPGFLIGGSFLIHSKIATLSITNY